MSATDQRPAIGLVACALLLTVATQVFYVAVVANAGADTLLRPLTWFIELAAFLMVAVLGHTLAARQPAAATLWTAVAVSGLLNLLQVAIGLSMFNPAMEAGEGQEQLFATVLAGAFFLYFLAKLVLGLAAVALGASGWQQGNGAARLLGAVGVLGGLAAGVLNALAMIDSETWMFAAGAAGTLATALVGAMLLTMRTGQQVPTP